MSYIINQYTVKLIKEKSGKYNIDNKVIKDAQTVASIVDIVIDINNSAVEKFGIITLTIKNKIIGLHIISVGSLTAAIVHPREVFQQAILCNASKIVCFHNHPSGDTAPSQDDIETTKRLVQAGEIMGIKVYDHVIVSEGNYYSFKENGKI